MPPTIDYEPHGGLHAFWHCRAPIVLVDGPAGTGKTYGILWKIVALAERYPGMRAWIGRKTRQSMTDSVLVTLEDGVLGAMHPLVADGPQRKFRSAYVFPNGSEIVVGGLDKPSKTFSAEYDVVAVFEAIECTAEEVELLLRTLRHGKMKRGGEPYHQLVMDTNPGPEMHWLNRRDDWLLRIRSRHEDNPRLWDREAGAWTPEGRNYMAILDSLTGARKERLRFGRWVSSEGAVYPEFDAAVHIIDPFPIPHDWPRYRSIDFGYKNPFSCSWYASDPDGRLYVYRQIYRTGRIVAEHAKEILKLSEGESFQATIADHDLEDRATLASAGIDTVPAMKDVERGLQLVRARLAVQGDKQPRLYFLRDALVEADPSLLEKKRPCCTTQEFDCYVWPKDKDGKPVKEEPVKENDHGLDELRYMVMHLDARAPVSVSVVAMGVPPKPPEVPEGKIAHPSKPRVIGPWERGEALGGRRGRW